MSTNDKISPAADGTMNMPMDWWPMGQFTQRQMLFFVHMAIAALCSKLRPMPRHGSTFMDAHSSSRCLSSLNGCPWPTQRAPTDQRLTWMNLHVA